MRKDNVGSPERDRLLARLGCLVGARRLSNDTSLADVTADAIEAALHSARRPPGELDAISDSELKRFAGHVNVALVRKGERSLPFGTKVIGLAHGVIDIGGRAYALQWSEPGLVPYGEAWRDNHAANLDRLLRYLECLMEHKPYAGMGPPSVAAVPSGHGPGMALPLLAFRPIHDADGLVLTLPLDCDGLQPFPTTPVHDLDRLALALDCRIRSAWNRRLQLGSLASERRREIASTIEAFAPGTGMAVGQIGVAAWHLEPDSRPKMTVELATLDDALRLNRSAYWVRLDEHAGNLAYDAAIKQRQRIKERQRLNALGADGQIDAVAAEFIGMAPGGASSALDQLAREPSLTFAIPSPNGDFTASLTWREGVIRGGLARYPDVDLDERRLRIVGHELPELAQIAAVGRTLGEVALPFPCGIVIRRCTSRASVTTLELAKRRLLVDLRAGRMWPKGRADTRPQGSGPLA